MASRLSKCVVTYANSLTSVRHLVSQEDRATAPT